MPCRHHWIIPSPPDAPVGVCRLCSTTREFSDSSEATDWQPGVLVQPRGTHPDALPLAPLNEVFWERGR